MVPWNSPHRQGWIFKHDGSKDNHTFWVEGARDRHIHAEELPKYRGEAETLIGSALYYIYKEFLEGIILATDLGDVQKGYFIVQS